MPLVTSQVLEPIIVLLYVLSPWVAHMACDILFSLCQDVNGVEHLEAAPWIVCHSEEHQYIKDLCVVQVCSSHRD